MLKVFRQYGMLFIIPGIVLGCSIMLRLTAGPFWLATNLDPSYQYLVNGLYLLKGYVPNHVDHPGTPLQMLCGAVCWAFNFGQSLEGTVVHVLRSPEFYLHSVFMILSALAFLSSLALAVLVYQKTGARTAAILSQLPSLFFLSLTSGNSTEAVNPVVANVSPEPLLIVVINLFNICFLMNYYAESSKDKLVSSVCWGFVCGLGAAVKLTFIPVLAVPLIILGWRDKFLFAVVSALSFFVWTLPIISRYSIIWGWISGIAMHKGNFQSGLDRVSEMHGYCSNLSSIIEGQWAYVLVLIAALVFVLWKFFGKKWDKGAAFLAAAALGVLIQFASVAQHPGARYLLPGQGLFSVLLVLFYCQWSIHQVLAKRIVPVLIAVFIIAGIWQVNGYRSRLAGFTGDVLAFHKHVLSKYQACTIINYYQSSDQSAALFFGDGWNLSPRLGKELFGIYPDKYYLSVWGNKILNFNDKVFSNDLLAQNACVLFQGDGSFDFSKGPYEVRLLEKGRYESIHQLTGTSEKEAALLVAGAMHFFQGGEYDQAMMCALQARKLHYQPDATIDALIKLFEPYLQH
jgi:hypothetical protein